MPNVNIVVLAGHLTDDPDLQYTKGGTAYSNFSVAVNRYWQKDGERQERVSFFDVTAWGNVAENVATYLGKGSPALIKGRLKQDRWEDDNGNNRSKVGVVAQNIQFLGSKNDDNEKNPQSNSKPEPPQPDEEDIPF